MSSQPPDDAGRSGPDDTEAGDESEHLGAEQAAADQDDGGRRSAAGTDPDRFRRAREQILECLHEPAASASRLPYLLSALEAEDQTVRWLAATACCQIAVETDDDELVKYLVRRLTDRLTAEGISLELTVALDYISSAYADLVGPLLADIAAGEAETPLPDVGGFTRSYYYGAAGRDGSRLQIAGAEATDNPEHVVADKEREQIEYERRRREEGDESEAAETDEATTDQLAGNSSTMVQESAAVTSITDQSRFDELYIKGERYTGRYATTYEALVGTGGGQRAVALRLFHQPDQAASLPAFGRDLADQLARWEAAGDHEGVVTVYDWGVESQPWVVTSLVEDVLAERRQPSPSVAFDHTLGLVDAVSSLHQNDVVHGGIDPRTVAFPTDEFDEDGADTRPLLNNVGLIDVFRFYFEPADCLDPRFAAPEYFDDQFGRVDHATDIYQLGAVCYLLFTGRPPFTGEFGAVREGVCTRQPASPSSVADGLPAALDGILAKTTAKQKLRRYETVEQFRGELSSLADEFV